MVCDGGGTPREQTRFIMLRADSYGHMNAWGFVCWRLGHSTRCPGSHGLDAARGLTRVGGPFLISSVRASAASARYAMVLD